MIGIFELSTQKIVWRGGLRSLALMRDRPPSREWAWAWENAARTHRVVDAVVLGLRHGVEALQALLLEVLQPRRGSLRLGSLARVPAGGALHLV